MKNFSDRRGDGAGPTDIHQVHVAYTRSALIVRVKVRDAGRNGAVSVFVDTVPQRHGPEFVLFGPVGPQDSDWRVSRTNGWRNTPVELLCESELRSLASPDVVRVRFDLDCLRNPDTLELTTGEVTKNPRTPAPPQVRVAVMTQGPVGGTDWSPRARTLHPAVARG